MAIPAILTDNFHSPYLEDEGLITKVYKMLSISKCSISNSVFLPYLGLMTLVLLDLAFYNISSSINDIFYNSLAFNLGFSILSNKLSSVFIYSVSSIFKSDTSSDRLCSVLSWLFKDNCSSWTERFSDWNNLSWLSLNLFFV